MSLVVTVDAAGQLVLPAAVRDQLQLRAGSRLILDVDACSVRLTPETEASPARIVSNGKRLVISGAPALRENDIVTAIQEEREERVAHLSHVQHE